jgi:NitT/TauT family transport system ATP-binding protein
MAGHLAVEQLSLTYSTSEQADTHAFGPVSFSVAPGEFVSIVGPSGCGKSSLLECVSGLIRPTKGEVKLDGQLVRDHIPPEVGMVFQQDASFPWLTVSDNIAFGLRYGRDTISAERIRLRVEEALVQVGLTEFAHHYPSQLSGGMRQRVSMARTLVMRPQLLLLDEPFAGVDPIAISDIKMLITKLKKQNIGVLITDHNVKDAIGMMDRVYIMYEGSILISGTAKEVVNNTKVRKLYLGEKFIYDSFC